MTTLPDPRRIALAPVSRETPAQQGSGGAPSGWWILPGVACGTFVWTVLILVLL